MSTSREIYQHCQNEIWQNTLKSIQNLNTFLTGSSIQKLDPEDATALLHKAIDYIINHVRIKNIILNNVNHSKVIIRKLEAQLTHLNSENSLIDDLEKRIFENDKNSLIKEIKSKHALAIQVNKSGQGHNRIHEEILDNDLKNINDILLQFFELIQNLIKAGAILNTKNSCGFTPLDLMLEHKVWLAVEKLVTYGNIPVSILEKTIWKVIYAIDFKDQNEASMAILAMFYAGVDPNIIDENKCTPIQYAAKNFWKTMVSHLLKFDPYKQYTQSNVFKPYTHNSLNNVMNETDIMLSFLPQLLAKGVNPNCKIERFKAYNKNKHYTFPLHYALNFRKDESICELLLFHGADPNLQDSDGCSAYDYDKDKTIDKALKKSSLKIMMLLFTLHAAYKNPTEALLLCLLPPELVAEIMNLSIPTINVTSETIEELSEIRQEIHLKVQDNRNKADSFCKIYSALNGSKSKNNFLRDKEKLMPLQLIGEIEKDISEHPKSDCAKAWELANEFKNDCSPDNLKLFNKIYKVVIKKDFFALFREKPIELTQEMIQKNLQENSNNKNYAIIKNIHQALK